MSADVPKPHVAPYTYKLRWPATLAIGLILISICEILLFEDIRARGWLVEPLLPEGEVFPPPDGLLQNLARWAAIHMTALCWTGYLFVLDGLLTVFAQRGNNRTIAPVRHRPKRFVAAYLTSILVWCFFDWVNFNFLHAWQYHNLPEPVWLRYLGYFLAFGAIIPAMLLTAQLYQQLGASRLQTTRGQRIAFPIQVGCVILGALFLAYPLIVGDPIGTLTLWLSLLFLLDPINHWVGAPSILGDWNAGRWGRTVSLIIAGMTCGLFWEFWNYWAVGKWTYDLPFLDRLEQYRYFEMPWIGMLGFLPFGLECWAALNTIILVTQKFAPRIVEPLPNDYAVI